METYRKPAYEEQALHWSSIWFKQLAEFHRRRPEDCDWRFTTEEVIAFLRSKRDGGVPAWKRMKIIEGLLVYRSSVQRQSVQDLLPLKYKMLEIIAFERTQREGYGSIEDVVGKINTREADAIQEFRRAMRRDGMAYATERSYVGKLKAFMADRALACLADFDSIGASDVGAHLTDLAVDGNVAPSTQNAAFHALLKFFTLVLKRDMGPIEAIRASKGKQIPTVLHPEEVRRVLNGLKGVHLVIAQLLYGCGMRISEAMRLRIKDLDFANR
ncbi:site-specific tyrosine recombinase XerC [Rosistilla ulvae]|uniref:Site-specific tyrosine recombinase XerC n=1 Tax=Rosistilla ulvae TaxID=1930277 RepID=A0A517M0S8_9BACT|nr:site-specific tyrosine recombinase XerC [Rosistilla ulvae]